MKQVKQRLGIFLVIITAIIPLPIHTLAAENDFSSPASAAFAVDYDTGKIFYNQNADEPLGIASMTKLITAYIVFDEIEKGNLSWDDNVPVSEKLKKMSKDPDLSNIPIKDKHDYTVKDALEASLISSANSLTSALAELISGSEIKFVDRMYKQLDDWNIKDGYLVSASGLGNEDMGKEIYPGSKKTDENLLSARSMAIVAREIITDFPEVLEIASSPSRTISDGTTIWNSNEMLPDFDYYTEGVDGLKTGTTPLAGACFVGTAKRGDQRIITVVMDVDPEYSRFQETANLMNYVYDNWSYKTVLKKGEPSSQSTINVNKGKKDKVSIVLTEDLSVWAKNDNQNIKIFFEPSKKQLTKKKEVNAPKKKGYIVGSEHVYNTTDTLGYLTKEEEIHDVSKVGLKTDIERANIFLQIWQSITKR
ncbi:serine hydrolase [Vagococcus carniphilus]|uniref:serine hydrolase n=1 Tax=Vagococcus carniphilus TaxID=218144 RepID=UPI00288E4BE6|nr:serine hydrolase [Vagococcus carniphilus]MDT2850091.1 serine hydrolase [Vagococcus carniphilus]MDT2865465.1 serine hydrolase [Vagococcus carniphilus]